jgi:predicted nucleic acid-binding protein
MSYLIDTNVLLRVVQKNSPMHTDARRAFVTLRKQSEKLCIIPQNVPIVLGSCNTSFGK